jgi:hypothetical protein
MMVIIRHSASEITYSFSSRNGHLSLKTNTHSLSVSLRGCNNERTRRGEWCERARQRKNGRREYEAALFLLRSCCNKVAPGLLHHARWEAQAIGSIKLQDRRSRISIGIRAFQMCTNRRPTESPFRSPGHPMGPVAHHFFKTFSLIWLIFRGGGEVLEPRFKF